MKRAAGEEDKLVRRGEILILADRLCRKRSYDEIRMADLAREAGIAKGTLYLYFPSKESLFLALLDERLAAAFEGLEARLEAASSRAGGPSLDSGELAREVTAALSRDLALPRLLAILHAELEKKVAYEEALGFKRRLAAFIMGAGMALSRAYPALSPEAGREFFLFLYAQIVGLVQLTDISPFMKRITAEPGLEVFKLGFAQTLEESARLILEGLIDKERPPLAAKRS
jgi:AcrR family transcriptional regulator